MGTGRWLLLDLWGVPGILLLLGVPSLTLFFLLACVDSLRGKK